MASRKILYSEFTKTAKASLWVATKNGLNQFLDGAASRYDRSEGLPNDNMGPVFQDRLRHTLGRLA